MYCSSDQREQQSGPAEMCRPGIWVDEDLDHQRHAEQGSGREASEQAEDEQHREQVLRYGRGDCGELGRQRHASILGAEQLVCAIGDREPAFDLGAARQDLVADDHDGGCDSVLAHRKLRFAPHTRGS